MTYDLGIDIGTSYSAAAVRRESGAVDVVGLGSISDSMPSVVYLATDGSILIGDAASRRSVTDPQGAAREFKRRLGDSTSIILRTSPFSAEQLYARMLEHVVARVIEREQGPPRSTVVTHPANWGPYKLELFTQALRISNLQEATGLTEPAAAAWAYGAQDRVPVGSKLAIYDLGGGTFDAAVLQKTDNGFEQLGESTGIEHLGGADFDDAILQWVAAELGNDWPTDLEDPQLPSAMLHLRRSCSEAKELLSTEMDVTIPVLLPGVDRTLTLTRPDFEAMIRPKIDESIGSLEAALGSAGVSPSDVTIVLVGGSSRIPMIGDELTHRFGPVVASDVDPLYAIARGAAMAAATRAGVTDVGASAVEAPAVEAPTEQIEEAPVVAAAAIEVIATPVEPVAAEQHAEAPVEASIDLVDPREEQAPTPEPAATVERFSPSTEKSGAPPWLPIAAAGLVILGLIGFLATRGGGDDPSETATSDAVVDDASSEDSSQDPSGNDAYDDSVTDTEVAGVVEMPGVASLDGMVSVTAGTYVLGTDKPESNDSETVTRTGIEVSAFFIDSTEVSNAQWKSFVDLANGDVPVSWGRAGFNESLADHPVIGVQWEWANAYCSSLNKRLPTETEWEVAARGPESTIYPWGDDVSLGGLPDIEDTYPVGSLASNVSGFGTFDMVGNAWEWVADSYDDRVNPDFRVLRGGQNGYLRETVTRLPVDPQRSNAFAVAGFRCAADQADAGVEPLSFRTDYERPEVSNEIMTIPLPAGVLILASFTDSTSGWVESSEDDSRFGYHPNEFFHLETKAPGVEVFTVSPIATEPGRPVRVLATAFVEPNLTQDAGDFQYGVFASHGTDGKNVSFLVNPRTSTFSVQQRNADGTYAVLESVQRNIPDDVELALEVTGDRYEFRLNGAVVTTRSIPGSTGTGAGMVLISGAESPKVHIHYEDFSVAYLDEAG